ncbi:hypothetical protein [Mesomycoplasma molare]|uniref:Transmembrane protein n=1 Tax=Mesomycoplasma molare TaxID=171288 RepID=A0ABY5TVH8_9BACT|nr:hypothetical protein [Mesomycoplasma molare]UWD34240.1 hypothetical protein NX772_00190 [Mesomycoplasma molare]
MAVKPNKKIVAYMENKIKSLKRISKIYFWLNNVFSFIIIAINIYSIILAILYLDYATVELIKDNSEIGKHITSREQWPEVLKILSYTAFFVIFLITNFFLSLFLAIFRSTFHYNNYKQVRRELYFLYIKYFSTERKEYSLEEFKQDLIKVEPILINKYKKNWKKEIKSTLLKKVS